MSRRTRKLRKENKKARQQLRYKNQYELDEIMHYFDGAPITDYQYEQIHRDLIAMLLDGQLRGVSSKAVIGEDPLAFCEATLAEIPPAGPARAVVLFVEFLVHVSVFSDVSGGTMGTWRERGHDLSDHFQLHFTIPDGICHRSRTAVEQQAGAGDPLVEADPCSFGHHRDQYRRRYCASGNR